MRVTQKVSKYSFSGIALHPEFRVAEPEGVPPSGKIKIGSQIEEPTSAMLVEESRSLASCDDPQLLLKNAVDTKHRQEPEGGTCLQTG